MSNTANAPGNKARTSAFDAPFKKGAGYGEGSDPTVGNNPRITGSCPGSMIEPLAKGEQHKFFNPPGQGVTNIPDSAERAQGA